MTKKQMKGGEKTIESVEFYINKINELQNNVDMLEAEREKIKKPSGKISIFFIFFGTLSLILSMINLDELMSQTPWAPIANSVTSNTQVLAFIGLGLVFWGALFFLIRPVSYVKSSLLDSTAISIYETIDRMINDLNLNNKGYYIPSLQKEAFVPEHLKGLKEMNVFISSSENFKFLSIEDIYKRRFLLENQKGILITPPGLGLIQQFEKELGLTFEKLDMEDLCDILPRLILEDYQLAKEVLIECKQNKVYLKISDSAYIDLYFEADLLSVNFLGSPLESAIACGIAKATGKSVTIQDSQKNLKTKVLNVIYQIMEG